jgi:hypothetical protein
LDITKNNNCLFSRITKQRETRDKNIAHGKITKGYSEEESEKLVFPAYCLRKYHIVVKVKSFKKRTRDRYLEPKTRNPIRLPGLKQQGKVRVYSQNRLLPYLPRQQV